MRKGLLADSLDITSGFIKQYDLLEYDWFPSYLEKDGKVFEELDGTVTQIVANRTTFTALTSTGNVYTWGDEMYKELLGREVSSSR
jgi:alpha-tubulin suppressor-like RCC1 family protein